MRSNIRKSLRVIGLLRPTGKNKRRVNERVFPPALRFSTEAVSRAPLFPWDDWVACASFVKR